jgi:hypothetical protein
MQETNLDTRDSLALRVVRKPLQVVGQEVPSVRVIANIRESQKNKVGNSSAGCS